VAIRVRTDLTFLRKRSALILARQIKALKEIQEETGQLNDDQMRQFKQCTDCLDDAAKLSRLLEGDIAKVLDRLVDSKLARLGGTASNLVDGRSKRAREGT